MTKTIGKFPEQIYFNALNKMEVGVIVDPTLGVLSDGKKIVKAGIPVKGDLQNRTVAVTAAGEADAIGVLAYDVDVTDGKANGTLCIFGWINLDRLDTSVKTKITTGVISTLKGSVTFLKDN